jgi:hypothetical protein
MMIFCAPCPGCLFAQIAIVSSGYPKVNGMGKGETAARKDSANTVFQDE